MVFLPGSGVWKCASKLAKATFGALFLPPVSLLTASQSKEKAVSGVGSFMPLISRKEKGGMSCAVRRESERRRSEKREASGERRERERRV